MARTLQSSPVQELQEQALERARNAAAASDPVEMLREFHDSGFFSGVVRRLASKWAGSLPEDDIQFAVSQATDEFYDTVRRGEKVLRVGAYIYKTAHLMAYEYHRQRKLEITLEDLEGSNDEPHAPPGPYPSLDEDEKEDLSWEEKRRLAIETVLRLIPTVRGGTNVRAVLDYLFRQMAIGRRDVPAAEIADFVGISQQLVRKSKERGLERLERAARQAGLAGCGFQQLQRELCADGELEEEDCWL